MISRVKFIRIPFVKYYHSNIIDHYESPRNVGSLSKKDVDVGTGLVGAPACGDVISLSIRVDKENTITEAYFKAFGCGSAIASSSYLTEVVKGMKIEEASKITNNMIAKHLKLPPVKLHCSLLAEDAINAAINDYKKKQSL
jgi:Fe-S cluster assembly scaffold IscU